MRRFRSGRVKQDDSGQHQQHADDVLVKQRGRDRDAEVAKVIDAGREGKGATRLAGWDLKE